LKHLFLTCVGTGLEPTEIVITQGVTARDKLGHLRLEGLCLLSQGVDPHTFFQAEEDVYARVNNLDRLYVFRMEQSN
jgi:hypothetical protein